MSANLYWKPNPKTNNYKCLNVGAPSSFMKILDRKFPGPPYTFNECSIATLEGMAAAYSDADNGFHEILCLIEKYGSIEVWPEY